MSYDARLLQPRTANDSSAQQRALATARRRPQAGVIWLTSPPVGTRSSLLCDEQPRINWPSRTDKNPQALTNSQGPTGLHERPRTHAPSRTDKNPRAFTNSQGPTGLHERPRTQGPLQTTKDPRAFTNDQGPKGLHERPRTHGPSRTTSSNILMGCRAGSATLPLHEDSSGLR